MLNSIMIHFSCWFSDNEIFILSHEGFRLNKFSLKFTYTLLNLNAIKLTYNRPSEYHQKNLASQILSCCKRRIQKEWPAHFGSMAESLVIDGKTMCNAIALQDQETKGNNPGKDEETDAKYAGCL